jgi:hypothetical protein
VWQGTAWVMLTDADTPPGLQLVKTQTIGSGVSSVTVTDAFSSEFDNYKIQIAGGSSSSITAISMTLGSTAANYYQAGQSVTYTSTSTVGAVNNAGAWVYSGVGNTDSIIANVEVLQPFITKRTFMNSAYTFGNPAGGGDIGFYAGYLNNSLSYTSFTFTPGAGTLTGGTIRVYGYRN